MSQDKNRNAIEQLRSLHRRLEARLALAEETARFRRSPDRSARFVEKVERATSLLELAIEAIDGRDEEIEDVSNGWLASRMGGLVRYLRGGVDGEPDGQGPRAPLPSTDITNLEIPKNGLVGDCDSLPVSDLLAMLQGQTKTGILKINHEQENVILHLYDGQLVHAYSESSPPQERLGEILVRRGALTRARLESVLFCHTASPLRFGEILTSGDVVTFEELEGALVEQVQGLFNRVFEMRGASFHFEPGLPDVEENRARLNLMQLLLESARLVDERCAD